MVDRKAFRENQSINMLYHNEENVFIAPNHQENGDYYENPSLSHLMDELLF